MSQQLQTETDRLANIIQVLQLGHKTGKLVVERNEYAIAEHGLITFVKGRITHVSANQQQGPDALNCLMSWGYCRFTFLLKQRPDLPEIFPQSTQQYSANSEMTSTLPTSLSSEEAFSPEITPTIWFVAPYPTRHKEEGIRLIDQMGLSRTHRHLFLLIDGRRTARELLRLTTRQPREVLQLLRDLEQAGVCNWKR